MTPKPPTRRARTPGNNVLLLAVAVVGVGVLLAAVDLWVWTVWLTAASLLLCSLARLVLPDHAAGWLRVRRKAIDVLATALMGVGIIAVFLSLPPRR